jgi:hypothetical protein
MLPGGKLPAQESERGEGVHKAFRKSCNGVGVVCLNLCQGDKYLDPLRRRVSLVRLFGFYLTFGFLIGIYLLCFSNNSHQY